VKIDGWLVPVHVTVYKITSLQLQYKSTRCQVKRYKLQSWYREVSAVFIGEEGECELLVCRVVV